MVDPLNRRQAIRFAAVAVTGGLAPCLYLRSAPAKPPSVDDIPSPLPVGRWCVEFTNEVIEVCEFRKDGTVTVSQPKRRAEGRVSVKGGRLVIEYQDERVERWSPVGRRMVVEHWFPSGNYGSGSPVLGIAEHLG